MLVRDLSDPVVPGQAGFSSGKPPRSSEGEAAKLLWEELSSKCLYVSTVGGVAGGCAVVVSLGVGRAVCAFGWSAMSRPSACTSAPTQSTHPLHSPPVTQPMLQGWWWYEVCYGHRLTQFHMTDKHEVDWSIALGRLERSNWAVNATKMSGLYPDYTKVRGWWAVGGWEGLRGWLRGVCAGMQFAGGARGCRRS